jgi:hypothetical protein
MPERSLPPQIRDSQLAVSRLHLKKIPTLVGLISRSSTVIPQKAEENVGLPLALSSYDILLRQAGRPL